MEERVKKMYTEYTYPAYDESIDKYAPSPSITGGTILEKINHTLYFGKKK